VEAKGPDLAALGLGIRGLREERGMSQEQLADAAGLHRTYVGGIERGERNIGFENLLKVAAALEVRPSELLARYEQARAG
jgi:transcriptional regulator with XRE-family HTH domain